MLLSDRIHAQLRDQILAGELAPGAAVPSERRLSEQLGASRHAVREALKRLQEAGLVRISQGGATRVRDWRHDGGLDLLLALAATGDVPPELELERAGLEMRASIGADGPAAPRSAPPPRSGPTSSPARRRSPRTMTSRHATPSTSACGTYSWTPPGTSPTGSRSTR